ncbi:hypothetical protein E4N70_09040 [Treponema vincentii]|uniref:hypothetical protein n=1 Tax=Treponema vincentii TaxID=69710 RepID=UPI0020A3EF68|nr:hypothetical protein [Treponema vincentii]UTC59579.1 hypothetical protein E4N70_09040 [Treponema vincentii]
MLLNRPAVNLYSRFVVSERTWMSVELNSLFSKGLRKGYIPVCRYCEQSSTAQYRHGWRWFYAVASLLANLQPKNVQGCTFLGEDVRGIEQ